MLRIEVLDEAIKTTYKDEQGALISKIVSPEDIAVALAKQTRIETGLLPRNTRYYTRSEGNEILVLEVPAHIRDVYFSGDQKFTIPMPPTLHILTIRNNEQAGNAKELLSSSLYCLKTPLVDNSTMLYKFPFGNVYRDGRVCWGSIRLPVYEDIAMFGAVPELIFSSNFNGDLDSGQFNSFPDPEGGDNNVSITRGSHLMRYLDKKEDFPYDVLISSIPFGEALRRVLNVIG